MVWRAVAPIPSLKMPVPFLGRQINVNESDEFKWEQTFSQVEFTFLRNHRVGTVPLLPGTCYIEMLRAVTGVLYGNVSFVLASVTFSQIMFLDDEIVDLPTTQVTLSRGFASIASRRGETSWQAHSSMELELQAAEHETLSAENFFKGTSSPPTVNAEAYYQSTGNDYRGEFKAMESAWSIAGNEILSKVSYASLETQQAHCKEDPA